MIKKGFRVFAVLILFVFALNAQEMHTFKDNTRGYAIDYPAPLLLQGGSYSANAAKRDTHYVRILSDDKLLLRGEFKDIQRRHKSFRAHAIDVVILGSAADGPDGSVWCEDIDSVTITRNPNGAMSAEMYFLKRLEGAGGERSEIVGPFFVIDISAKQALQSLYLDWRPAWKPSPEQIRASRSIVKGIRFLE